MGFKNNKYIEAIKPSKNFTEFKSKAKLRLVIVTMLFIVYAIGVWAWLGYKTISEGFDLSHKPLTEYNSLFNKEVQIELQDPFVFKSKIKQPESNYLLKNDFHLTVNRLLLISGKPLSQILSVKNTKVNKSDDAYSGYVEDSQLKMTRTTNGIGAVSIIDLKYQGDLKTIVQNDSLACYYLKFKGFSISYDNSSDNDIWAHSESSNNAAISLAFIKKDKYLYVILLFKNTNETQDFPADSLYELLKK